MTLDLIGLKYNHKLINIYFLTFYFMELDNFSKAVIVLQRNGYNVFMHPNSENLPSPLFILEKDGERTNHSAEYIIELAASLSNS